LFFKILILILGFILLISGADLLVKGSSNIAKKFNIPQILIGLTIVALGTSLPELIITIISANKGSLDLIIGNVIGSNICNLLLILGISSIIKSIKINKTTRLIYLPILFFSSLLILLMGLGFLGGEKLKINKFDGIILILLFVIYFSYPIIKETITIIKNLKNNNDNPKNNIKLFLPLTNILIGIILLKYGGDFVVDSATDIAQLFNINQTIIGLTVIALGTSLPELVTSIVAVIKKDEDIAVGNIFGSCIMNYYLILGTGALLTDLPFEKSFNENLFLLLGVILLIWLFSFTNTAHKLIRVNGLLLLLIFSLYIIKLLI